MQIDPFFQVPQHPSPTSIGEVQLPLLLKEGDAFITLYSCDREKVVQQLEGTGLQPALVIGKRALVSITLYNFENSSIGPYRTALLAIPVVRSRGFRPVSPWRELFLAADKRHMGFHLIAASTNTAISSTTARDVWGYPQQLAKIDFTLKESRLDFRLSDGVNTIMQLRGNGLRLAKIKALEFNMFSFKQGALLRTLLNTRGHFELQLPLGYRLDVGHLDHPFNHRLKALDLHGKIPLIAFTSTDYQGRMNEGVIVEMPQPKTAAEQAYINRMLA